MQITEPFWAHRVDTENYTFESTLILISTPGGIVYISSEPMAPSELESASVRALVRASVRPTTL